MWWSTNNGDTDGMIYLHYNKHTTWWEDHNRTITTVWPDLWLNITYRDVNRKRASTTITWNDPRDTYLQWRNSHLVPIPLYINLISIHILVLRPELSLSEIGQMSLRTQSYTPTAATDYIAHSGLNSKNYSSLEVHHQNRSEKRILSNIPKTWNL